MQIEKSFTLHPFLLTFFPVFLIFTGNITLLDFNHLILPTLFVLIPTIVLFIFLTFFFKNTNKSGLMVSLTVLLFFSYGHIFRESNKFLDLSNASFDITHWILFTPFLLIIILGFLYCIKTTRKLNNVTSILNIISITLIIFLAIPLITYDFNPQYNFQDDISISTEFILLDNLDKYPDIYYIILDEYAGEEILNNSFNYNNNNFINFLDSNGFHILKQTTSNYPYSFLSISSALNMNYVNFFSEEVGIESQDRRLAYKLFHDNRVMQLFESNGYSTVNFNSGWGPTTAIKMADQNMCTQEHYFSSEMLIGLLSNSMLNPIYVDLLLPVDRERVLCIFSELSELQFKTEKPLFVLAHIMLPHGPYVWGPDGEHKKINTLNKSEVEDNKQGYIDQLTFTNKMIQEVIEKIVENDKRSEIIIIQSDHGASIPMDWENPTEQMQYERLSNINYIMLPDVNDNLLEDTLTPVNVFRVLLNNYFNTNFELLENRVYYSEYDKPFNFTEITYMFEDP